jgi:hypothetical protein
MTAIDPKRPKQNLGAHPRLKRVKPKPAPLLDDLEARLLMVTDEKTYRETLFRDFVKFCREHDGVVVSVPWQSPARVLVPLGDDGEKSRLEKAFERFPKYRIVKLPAMVSRLSHGVFQTMQQLSIELWR